MPHLHTQDAGDAVGEGIDIPNVQLSAAAYSVSDADTEAPPGENAQRARRVVNGNLKSRKKNIGVKPRCYRGAAQQVEGEAPTVPYIYFFLGIVNQLRRFFIFFSLIRYRAAAKCILLSSSKALNTVIKPMLKRYKGMIIVLFECSKDR